MLSEVIKAILIGIIASAPLGPVSLLVMQKTFCYGRGAGMAAGIGSAIIDTLYALLCIFALMFIEDFIERNEALIMLIGGALVVTIGASMFFRTRIREVSPRLTSKSKAVQYAGQAALCALANPGAVAYMFALMTLFRIDPAGIHCPVWMVVLFVFAGAFLWWFGLVLAADRLRENFKLETLSRINKSAGAVVVVFGLVLVVRGIILLV